MSISVPDPVGRRRARRGLGGRLRDEILDATSELLLEAGTVSALSIRAVSERVGVTPPSIYLHFADKDALLAAAGARYFEKLDRAMQSAAIRQSTPLRVLRALMLAYVRFALAAPALYRIAVMSEVRPGSAVDVTLANSAFQHIVVGVAVGALRPAPTSEP